MRTLYCKAGEAGAQVKQVIDGFGRALRAWRMALLLMLPAAALAPALAWRDRLAAADFGIGGFPFHISSLDYYTLISLAQLATLAAFVALWIILAGGIIDRLARDARSSGSRFFAASGACALPLARLALLYLAACWFILARVSPWLASLAEGAGDTARLALYGVLALLLFALALVFDYARIRLVIEDRRSAIGAIAAGARLLRARPGQTLAAQALFWFVSVAWISSGRLIANALATDWTTWPSFAIVLLFMLVDLLLKLALTATQASIYQDALASAGWVARAEPVWPDDASANPAAI